MVPVTIGKVVITARLDNLQDLFKVNWGSLLPEDVRGIEVTDALVDTGASGLLAPSRLIAALGLEPLRLRHSPRTAGTVVKATYRAVRLTILGRDCICDVDEIPDEFPVLVGRIPLHMLDWLVDTKNHRLIGNPEHGGEPMVDVF
jgi:predicted aspartyl protease